MNQGEVRWCRFPSPDHERPAVILTRQSSIPGLNSVTVAPITSKLAGLRTRVPVGESDGLAEPSEVNVRNLQTVPKRLVGSWIATLSDNRMHQINTAVAFALGFDRYE